MIRIAATTLSKLASGSPMPIITTLVIGCRPCSTHGAVTPSASSARLACQSWPMISATDRFRLKPCLPVEQKAQSSAQPACEDTQRVPRYRPDEPLDEDDAAAFGAVASSSE